MKVKLTCAAVGMALMLSSCDSANQLERDGNTNPASDHKTVNTVKVQQDKQLTQGAQLNQWYQEATQTLFQHRVFSASAFGLSAEEVGVYYADKVEDFSPKNEALLRKKLRTLSDKIGNLTLTTTNKIDKDNQQVMASIVRYYAGDSDFSIGYIDAWMGLSPFIINQINGPLISIPRNLQNDHSINNEKDAIDYIERLSQFDDIITSVDKKLAADTAKNWLPPKAIVEGALRYLDGFISAPAQQHTLVESFISKVNKIDTITPQRKQQLINEVVDKVSNVVYPAYQKITQSTELLLTRARPESGIWAQPNGEDYYQDAIEQLGDSQLSADEIHQLGLDEVKRISSEMNAILLEQGYKTGSVGQRMVLLNEEERFLYPDSDEGRAAIIQDINEYIEEIVIKMAPVFKTTPSYDVEVRAYPVEIQEGSPGGEYSSPSVDGSKPGIYWINLRDMKANPKFGLKTLTYHEANPGHHWQIALNMDQAELPFLRRIAPYNAYMEGWALYAEQVAQELGMYENDPFGNLGRLQAELYRAVRLVVDTGLHHKRWTREQAISYMVEQTGSTVSDITAEIERYMAWPGQALGYKLGMLKIVSLRDQAKKALGNQFDLSGFHDVVLLGGAVPMSVLERNVNQWIASKR